MSKDSITLELQPRDVLGKQVRQLRRQGLVPAVIHDHGKASIIVSGNYVEVYKAYLKAGKHSTVELKSGNKTYTAIIKEASFEPKKNQLNHIVFGAVKAGEKITTELPVRIKYDEGNDSTPAERNGLVVLLQLEVVQVEALPKDLVDFVEFDGEKLIEAGDHVTVGDIIVPSGIIIKDELTQSLAAVFEPSALQAANDDAGGSAEADADVPAENGTPASDVDSQAQEDQPGGKKQFEPKGE